MLAEAPVSTLIPPLGTMFVPADDHFLYSFINVPGVWPSSAAIFIYEEPDATLLPSLVSIVLGFDGVLHYPPPPLLIVCYICNF